ncbi:L-aspartate oxidase [Simkania negevensis]|uniref:L-aspartate oxidase n=1 Tax=Simkania negevensis (strain ATCC VR-1471 / DSM 27360 / Z) TaxID=331113 RepID=F8L8X2_SIMNZ|nr:L-aspartate oxidase [Simkania negevensis]CCB89271.1 l-aspartate oxidase 1 [Simkania negevensis Z]
MIKETDVLVIGLGVAGGAAALELAKKGLQVTLISSGDQISSANSYRAQGGVGYRASEEFSDDFKGDILKAGAGLCYEKAVDRLVELGPACVEEILLGELQVPFQRDEYGKLKLTREAAHQHPRILYHQDQTGRVIMEALLKKILAHPNITTHFRRSAVDLITLSHHSKKSTDIYYPPTCVGAYVFNQETEQVNIYFAKETILATGGVGEVFLHTTNTREARGDGLAMAFRAGVRIMNLEYIQFHPTSFYKTGEPRFLLSEALRGEGGKLLSKDFKPFMAAMHPQGDLAPRDIVARGIFQEMVRTDSPHLWLDLSFKNPSFLEGRFPHIYAYCKSKGVDLTREPLPIVPAAHYSCGGIAVDLVGKTTMRNLRAIGEVSCTGVHGANRLASTALLEGLVWAKAAAADIVTKWEDKKAYFPEVDGWQHGIEEVDQALIQQDWLTIKQTMWNYVGLIRSPHRLKRAVKMLTELKWEINSFYANAKLTPELLGLRNGCQTALLITEGASRNPNSRGCHFRLSSNREIV